MSKISLQEAAARRTDLEAASHERLLMSLRAALEVTTHPEERWELRRRLLGCLNDLPTRAKARILQGSREFPITGLGEQEFEDLFLFLRKLESLDTVREGLRALQMTSLLDWFWDPSRIYNQASLYTHSMMRPYWFVPGLRARMFYDRSEFPWVRDLEASYPEIRRELLNLFEEGKGFQPVVPMEARNVYVKANDMLQVQQKGEPARGGETPSDWNMFYFYVSGRRMEENCRLCPRTTAVLNSIPALNKGAFTSFSALNPGTNIPEHYGPTNAVIRVHLGLIVPRRCYIRVGTQIKSWEEGKALIFNDAFEHQVSNDDERTRVVLFFDVAHPDWKAGEAEIFNRLSAEQRWLSFDREIERDRDLLTDRKWWT